MLKKMFLPVGLLLAMALSAWAAETSLPFHHWAPTPPMGWNSWDCFAATVNEAQTRANADVMAARLKSHGWEYIVVDIQWYEPLANGFNYRKDAKLETDEYGRLLPAVNRFPSATNGAGFKVLADYVHSLGLRFGIHVMRGIPRQAVAQNLPIKGTTFTARDIANTNSFCSWNGDMFGVDMSKPGAQEYYDSVYELIASWGVDFVKVDDLSRPYPKNRLEVEAIRKAIDKTGRPIVFSTSPGETPVAEGKHVAAHANMWRISDDFWDSWRALLGQFERLNKWTPYRGAGHFPDADMLPLGAIRQVGSSPKQPPHTRFTPEEQVTMMSLWSIARSPLMMGGDMTKLDDFTLSLLTNDAVLAVNQHSENNRQLFRRESEVGWIADAPGSSDKYLALFNISQATKSVPVELSEIGAGEKVRIQNLWTGEVIADVTNRFAPELPAHGAGLYRVSEARAIIPALAPARLVDTNTLRQIYEEIKTPFKYGVVLQGADTNELMDCPSIFRSGDRWYMMYVAISNHVGYQTFLARSDDLLHWEKLGKILSFAPTNAWDAWQADGGIALGDYQWEGSHALEKFDGKFWLSYIGGALPGYETDPLSIGLAWTDDPTQVKEWNRLKENPVLGPKQPDARDFEKKTLYKSQIIRDEKESLGWPFVMFYNAKYKNGYEQIGMAVSRDMVNWARYGTNSVLVNGEAKKNGMSGDPQIVKIGDVWVMFYFGAGWKPKAFDTFACSYDLVHWTKWEGEHLVEPSEPFDTTYAHKPWVVKWNGVVYHFYCAVGNQGRVIALATSRELKKSAAR